MTISEVDRVFLTKEVTYSEILMTIKLMDKGKSLGPHGLNIEFYLFYWDIIKDPLYKAISHFLATAQLPKTWGEIYLVLIPKSDNPKLVLDFRPISLCNVSYKIISKLLTNHLKQIIHKIVGKEQSAFLAGKSCFDNIIAAQKIVHSLESEIRNPPRMILKVDIAKAYDMVEWEAVLATLHLMNFPVLWISWIRACMSCARFAILINGQVTQWFDSGRGLRQGDPLSPYLFLLISQNLSAMLNHALYQNWIPGFDGRLNVNFNHLMFTDDLIIVTRASRSAARACRVCLDTYRDLTGQMPNANKSNIYFPSCENS